MHDLPNRIEKLGTSKIAPKVYLHLLNKIACQAEKNILRYRKERFPILEHYWIGRHMSIREIVEALESYPNA